MDDPYHNACAILDSMLHHASTPFERAACRILAILVEHVLGGRP